MLDEKSFLSTNLDEEIMGLAKVVLDKAKEALTEYRPLVTPFYDPEEITLLLDILKSLEDLKVIFHGGYTKAKRKRLELRPLYYLPPLQEKPVALLKVTGEIFQGLDDLRKMIRSCGFEEDSIGDLLFVENGMEFSFIREGVETLKEEFKKKGKISLDEIRAFTLIDGYGGKDFPATVASLRLDSVASAGFGTSRSKMKREILLEKVMVNGQLERNPSRSINIHDTITMETRGDLKIVGVLGETKRGRMKLLLKRYS